MAVGRSAEARGGGSVGGVAGIVTRCVGEARSGNEHRRVRSGGRLRRARPMVAHDARELDHERAARRLVHDEPAVSEHDPSRPPADPGVVRVEPDDAFVIGSPEDERRRGSSGCSVPRRSPRSRSPGSRWSPPRPGLWRRPSHPVGRATRPAPFWVARPIPFSPRRPDAVLSRSATEHSAPAKEHTMRKSSIRILVARLAVSAGSLMVAGPAVPRTAPGGNTPAAARHGEGHLPALPGPVRRHRRRGGGQRPDPQPAARPAARPPAQPAAQPAA